MKVLVSWTHWVGWLNTYLAITSYTEINISGRRKYMIDLPVHSLIASINFKTFASFTTLELLVYVAHRSCVGLFERYKLGSERASLRYISSYLYSSRCIGFHVLIRPAVEVYTFL